MTRHDSPIVKLGLSRSRLRPADLLAEAYLSVSRAPGRTLLTTLGTVLGAGAFVAILGLGTTLERQVADTFDVRRATEVVITPEDSALPSEWQATTALNRLRSLNGVAAAGGRVTLSEQSATALPGDGAAVKLKLIGADEGAVDVMDPHIVAGRAFDAFHNDRAVPVIMLPSRIAETLAVDRAGVAVFINDQAYLVIGIYDDVVRRPEALLAGIVPLTVADRLVPQTQGVADRDVIIATSPGAARLIAEQAPIALSPEDAEALLASSPPDPRLFRQQIERSVTTSTVLLSIVALAIGTLAIGNAAAASVAGRAPEIGLRRAIGGRPSHIFQQLLVETTVIGLAGGTFGVLVGVTIVAGASAWNGWVPVLNISAALEAIGAGAASGLVAGLIPAVRATRIQPVSALQR